MASRLTPMYDGQGHRAPGLLRMLWNRLRARHDDGTKHVLIKDWDWDGWHSCDGDYCHHYQMKCTVCDATKLCGYATEEIR